MGSVGSLGSVGSVLAVLGFVGFGFAQLPQITNGKVVAVASTIEREVSAAAAEAEPSWVAWKVPSVDGRSRSCCWYSNNDEGWYGCGLEPREAGAAMTRPQQPTGPVPLEAGATLLVMARVANGTVERVRTFSDDCPLDAGGRTVRVIDPIAPDASIRWLSDLVGSSLAADPKSSIYGSAMSAIANTGSPAADAALARLAEPSQPAQVRRQAALWLGRARGSAGFATLKAMLGREPQADMRRTIVRAIGQSKLPDATPAMIAVAKTDTDQTVRREAMLWLGRSKDPRATKFFEEILIK